MTQEYLNRGQWSSKLHRKSDASGVPGVYFVKPEGEDCVKIGATNGLKVRLSELQTGNPRPLHVELFVPAAPGQNYLYLESDYHKRFADLRLHGEWFDYTGELKALLESFNARAYCPCRTCKPPIDILCSLCRAMMTDAHAMQESEFLVDADGNGYCTPCLIELQKKAENDPEIAEALTLLWERCTVAVA